MIIIEQKECNRRWFEECDYIECRENPDKQTTIIINKRKLLNNIAKLEEISTFHMLLLDNLSRISRIIYHYDSPKNELIFNLYDNTFIKTVVPYEDFIDLFSDSNKYSK